MSEPQRPALRYRPELDGVRAVAVLAVLGFHVGFGVPWFNHLFRGGFLGVDVFFVLSGMLITELLVSEHITHGVVSLRGFYRRRALRLLPALAALLVLMTAYYSAVRGRGQATVRGLISVVSYVSTGHLVGQFPAGLSQVWTLVVEWEFYLVWPLVLVVLLRRGVPLRTLGYLAVGAALTLTVIRALVFHFGGGNWTLSYYLAWLRFDELLVGCAVGLLGARPQAPDWLQPVALGAVLVVITRVSYPTHWLYLGGMFGLAAATAIVIQPRLKPTLLDRALASGPMVWIGKLSYSLYLWSVPAISEIARHTTTWPAAPRVVVFLAGSFALASASYYLIERRFRLPSRRPLAATPAAST